MPLAYVLTMTEKDKIPEVINKMIYYMRGNGIQVIESCPTENRRTIGPFSIVPDTYTTVSKVLLDSQSRLGELNEKLKERGIKDALILTDSRD
jgi:hypothetical protein